MANDVRTIILPTDAEDPSTVLSSLFSEASGSIGGMVRDDGETFAIILADASTSGLRSYDARAIPDGTTAILAIGLPDRPPSGGTFLLSYDGVSTNTAAIPANPTAAELQTALNANPSRFAAGPVTVLKDGADYRITDTNPGVRSLLSANGTFLIPLSSATVRQYRAGTADGEREIQILSLRQSPYAAQTAFDPLPAAGYTLSTVAAGTTDTPAVQLLTLDPAPYGGTFTVDSKIIPFDASEQTFANAYGGGVSVSKAGDFAWQFTQGANGALVSTVSIAKLLVPKGFLITLNLSTFEFLFAFSQLDAGADSFLAYLSFQVTFPGKLPKTYLRRLVEIFRSVINPGALVSAALPGFPDAASVAPPPRIVRVESTGSNTLGVVGGAPFATAQAAYAAALAYHTAHGGNLVLKIGVGTWTVALDSAVGWPQWLTPAGCGKAVCSMSLTFAGTSAPADTSTNGQNAPPVIIICSPDFALSMTLAAGNGGADSGTGNGGQVASISVFGACLAAVTVTAGASGEGGGDGGSVSVSLVDCLRLNDASSVNITAGDTSTDVANAGTLGLTASGCSFDEMTLTAGNNNGTSQRTAINGTFLMVRVENLLTMNAGGASSAVFRGGFVDTFAGAATDVDSLINLIQTAYNSKTTTGWNYDE